MKKKVTNVHFTLETRKLIEERLNESKTITEISNELQRDRSNIGKEIMKHRIATFPSTFNYDHPCLKHVNCSMKTYECYKTCKNIEIKLCENLISSPHVCNGCQKKKYCRHVRYYYNAVEANNEYVNSWKKDRSKLRYTPLELDILNNDFKVLVLNCKSIYHALIVINKRGFNFKISTIYKQIERGQLALKKSDLPRCRKTKQKEVRDKSYKRDIDGHTYEDYNSYKEENPNAVETQMDTVEGIKENDAPVFFTIEIVDIKFILIFKLTSQNAKEVSNKLKLLKQILGNEIIEKIFEILLTDNGKEFIRLDDLQEILPNANIFYCHPYSSYEKGNIENNHELIRRVIPKGVSLKCYTQKDLDLLCSHINSLYRESLDGKCPFDLVENYISKNVLDKLNLKRIDDDKVVLVPKLLGEKNINNIKKYLDKKEIEEANITL
ncbi:MAG TPA: IS30 family transposase [Candidatus Onthousia excrementipullorum]|uniref:IS30 family transposase n=1 Tax=Candidatus Onthousia excrementipullorum TaxID=2840884 RepID=A0A9D1J2L7_9FIRM|nr:IS30 family transposase [Candidatus Onthousia excrementipullorum]